ncbi:MAG: mannose-1-phosphate guanylyltransferase/mannose-6-phosphate isomerase [Colwellia sp.]|nr:mannose-1-phosphate guanylyltransferase/mannose-6-phosphate isomerase [Colwellia sp.]
MKVVSVVLSGGVGSRLWPASRARHPKPFIRLPDGENLIQKTFRRALSIDGVVELLVVTNDELYFKTIDEYQRAQLPETSFRCILEPFGKNTAASVLLSCLSVKDAHGEDAAVLILPADHLINDHEGFGKAVSLALQAAEKDKLVTFGLTPNSPETGYGYIEADLSQPFSGGFVVNEFHEKPSLETAQEFLDSGNYYWNSGIFCFKASVLIEQFETHSPELFCLIEEAYKNSKFELRGSSQVTIIPKDLFSQVHDISIDYALFEKSKEIVTIPSDFTWSDIGSWLAMSQLTPEDANSNRLNGEVYTVDSTGNYVRSRDKLTALVGVDDLIVVDTVDALLVAHKDKTQDVKKIVSYLKAVKHETHELHKTVHRPWGSFTTLESCDRFKIKRIVVKPKASLSLQMHHHRSEHWIVVSGMAKVVNNNEEFLLNSNESTFILAGHSHRLENPGVIELVLIEVQSGDYLGEDDICRLDDIYGRLDLALTTED